MHFATIADWLEPAKLTYACSAHYIDHTDNVNLTPEQQAFIKEIPDFMFRESVRDFMVNQQFRRDYWVKGLRKLSPLQRIEMLRAERVILVSHRPDIELKATGSLGEAKMSGEIYTPILDILSDHKIRTVGEIDRELGGRKITFNQLSEAILILSGVGHIASAQDDTAIAKAKKQTLKLNMYLCEKARGDSDINDLASPVTGGGIAVGRFQQIYLLAISKGYKHPQDWANFTWQILKSQGQKILKDGKALETDQENIAEITEQANSFATKKLPILKALQLI